MREALAAIAQRELAGLALMPARGLQEFVARHRVSGASPACAAATPARTRACWRCTAGSTTPPASCRWRSTCTASSWSRSTCPAMAPARTCRRARTTRSPAAVHAVLDIADALGWDRFALLGHSMGAAIGSLVAAARAGARRALRRDRGAGRAGRRARGRTAARLREAVAATARAAGQALRVFPDIDAAVRARMAAGRRSAAPERTGRAAAGRTWRARRSTAASSGPAIRA